MSLLSTRASSAFRLLFLSLVAFACPALAQFTSGNVVVLQAGDGSGSLAGTGNPIVLKEFTPVGAAGITVTVPSTGATPLIMAGSSTAEGNLSLSSDGTQLVFGGYAQGLPNATALGGSTAAAINRAIGTVNASGAFTRLFPSATLYSGVNIRGAGSDGTNYWAVGSGEGTDYFGPGAQTVVSAAKTNLRAAAVFNGQLYISSASTNGTPGVTGVFAVGSGLPTTSGQTLTTIAATANTSTSGFYFNSTGTVLYVGVGTGVQKWTFSGTWNLAYTLTFTNGANSVVADFSGPNPVVYVTVGSGTANTLAKFTDPGAGGAVTLTTLATAPANTSFRSVAFAPSGACTTPAVTGHPGSASVCVGAAPVNFNVTATGTAPLSYQWRKNTVNLSNGGAISGATTATLTVNPASGAEAGSYDCVVTNACGNATSNAATLTIDTTDTDGDGTADCNDGCPNDPNKVAPGLCGCGVLDTDGDGDGTPDCVDGCPADPNKTSPGICGCGVADTDTDGDGTPNCVDNCPNDPNKIAPGICGCGVSDVDSDGDGLANCVDNCPNAANPLQENADGDATGDACDPCPNDPLDQCLVCGPDSDGDGIGDLCDGCPADPAKTTPGVCGCGVPETDTDGDGAPDCIDLCPNDPNKIAPGACGCGVADTDGDGDGFPDCIDNCPTTPNPGQENSDGDGAGDACDGCPNDANKVAPGACGCGVADTDTDGDGTPDCNDLCPNDPNKIAPGICGCGVADTDTDGDGTPNCNDGCPNDPAKTSPGFCGCGHPDADTNFNGLSDCLEITLSELLFNPPGTDNGQEFVELRGVAGHSLAGYYLLAIEGDTTSAGVVDVVYPLSSTLGSNGLLLARDAASVISPAPAAGTTVLVADFSPDIENGSNTYVLGFGTPPTVGTDLDSDNDGTLNGGVLPGFTIVDAIGVLENDTGGNVGYGDDLGFLNVGPFAAFTPDGLVRIYNANGSTCNWNGGDVSGTNPGGPYTFSATANFGFANHGLNLVATPVDLSPGNSNLLPDADADGLANACDPCTDTDGDGFGDPGYPNNTCALDGCPNDPNKSTPGICGCGTPDTDTDGDGTPDCNDGCPNDPNKVAPGICGCGTPDTDTDGDGTADCNDGCPNDPNKIAPGICGCGVADTDTDGDGTPDCNDGCPNDPNKIAPGICGCGVADTDTDGDGTADCNDGCPNDPNKIAPGICGCGTADTDTDGDGTPDCNDGCPNDPNKIAPGICGCGVADTDTDGDGTPDCNDGCPNDPNKIAPGICGCGVADTDTDGDGTPDCNDLCPNDPNKVAPGICGCGTADTDTDGDGTPDCNDLCPNDPNKVAPGICGCGTADTDTDGDGTPDCNDLCPNDPNKVAPGICGCGTADTDTDGDGTADCNDGCPNDPSKIAPGICGCGVADTDTDGDGTADCNDGCPNDPNKIAPGICGCGVADTDTDGDGTADCNDLCPTDPAKTVPGLCGCLVPEGCSLGTNQYQLSVTTGGVQQFYLYAGASYVLQPYFLLGTTSGTTPGFTFDSLLIPINIDAYTNFTIASPNKPPLTDSLGVINLFGFASAKLTVPAGTTLVGLTVSHAYVVIEPTPLSVVFVSNPVSLTLVP
ncbi:MAG: hypothetical protein FJ299_09045 [Planctomycetes bacterium]|nr:hypothetical protein [Planctomycetota bacterium]